MSNIRKTDSKDKIKQAFIKLLLDKGYDKISISSLTKAANINRGTFNLNYLDKEDLLATLEKDFFTDINKILAQDESTPTSYFSSTGILKIIYYLQANYNLIYALINSDISSQFTGQFSEVLKKAFLKKNANLIMTQLPKPYATDIIFNSIITIFTIWIKRKMPESPKELVNIVEKYSELSPKEILGK